MNNPASGAVSLKVLAERKVDGVQKTTQFKVDPRRLEIEDTDAIRAVNPEQVAAMKIAYRNGTILPPIFVRVDDGRIIVVDGAHRTTMFKELIADGEEIMLVDAIQFRGSDADRIAHMLTSNQGLPLTSIQKGEAYRRLENYGWTPAKIAEKIGMSTAHVDQMLIIASANSDVQQAVTAGEVSASNAIKIVRQHGSNAGAVIQEQLTKAKSAGKAKVTAKTIKGSTTTLAKAIQAEIDSHGATRAETLCPEHADLIAYLRNFGKVKALAEQVMELA